MELVEQLNNKEIIFIALKESIDTTTTPTGVFMLTVFGAVKDRQMEGIAVAVA
ncbi:hypothetical protein [Clostridium sp.]|uniref:hypothetical protein n=1 Tax=Clostridium sp. TaxID=1506 RepID=UPI0025C43782|nr:hypothetical protein [Clostridium sp.]